MKTSADIIAAWCDLAPGYRAEGLTWYQRAHDSARNIARQSGHSVATVGGVIARLSPAVTWGHNVRAAADLCITGDCDYGGWGPNLERARMILSDGWTAPPRGPKIAAFRCNIVWPDHSGAVTIDRHILRWLGLPERVTPAQYRALEVPWRAAATTLRLRPHQIQAGIWLAARAGAFAKLDKRPAVRLLLKGHTDNGAQTAHGETQ